MRITLDKTEPRAFDEFLAAAREVPEVIEIQTFLGRVDMRLSVIARDMAHYQQLYRDRILTLPHIADIEALMHVARVKSRRGAAAVIELDDTDRALLRALARDATQSAGALGRQLGLSQPPPGGGSAGWRRRGSSRAAACASTATSWVSA